MEEYASILLRFFCGNANKFPTVIVTAESTAKTVIQSIVKSWNTTRNKRAITAKPAALEAVERKPETGVGAPSYTSGAQKWNGTIETLNPRPTIRRMITPKIMGADICPALNASARA